MTQDPAKEPQARSYRVEFPDFPPETMPELPSDFEDISWRNDACPQFWSAERRLSIWIDYLDPDQRRIEPAPSGRYVIFATKAEEAEPLSDDALIETDDIGAALRVVHEWPAPSVVPAMAYKPDARPHHPSYGRALSGAPRPVKSAVFHPFRCGVNRYCWATPDGRVEIRQKLGSGTHTVFVGGSSLDTRFRSFARAAMAGLAALNHADRAEETRAIRLTARQRAIVRDALKIAYCDDDAPIFDKPEGAAELRAVEALLAD